MRRKGCEHRNGEGKKKRKKGRNCFGSLPDLKEALIRHKLTSMMDPFSQLPSFLPFSFLSFLEISTLRHRRVRERRTKDSSSLLLSGGRLYGGSKFQRKRSGDLVTCYFLRCPSFLPSIVSSPLGSDDEAMNRKNKISKNFNERMKF